MTRRGPKTKIDDEQLQALMRLKPSIQDVAVFFKVHEDTVIKHIRRHHDMKFSEFREKYMVETRFMLVRTALKQARAGNTAMLIFCLKNLCGWADKQELSAKEGKKFTLAYSLEDEK